MTTHDPTGRKIKEARHRLRWTQFQLARRVDCSESQIAKIETGRIRPDPRLKDAIARELGLPVKAFDTERFDQLLALAQEGNAEAIADLWREFEFHFGKDAP